MLETPFSGAIVRFHVLGIPVGVEVGFLVTTLLLAGGRRGNAGSFATWLAIVFVSILVHELGHALAGRRFGLTPSIRIYGWGGLTSWTAGGPLSRPRSLLVALAGPALALVLGVACVLARRLVPAGDAWLRGVVDDLVWVNVGWSFVNLVPVLPLDGGLACEAVWGMVAPLHAEQGARAVSVVAGLGVGALALAYGWKMQGAFAIWLGLDSARRLVAVNREARDAALIARLQPVFSAAIDAGDGPAVIAAAEAALREATTDRGRTWVLENLAVGRVMTGALEGAVDALAAAPIGRPPAVEIEAFVVAHALRERRRAVFARAGLSAPEVGDTAPWVEALERLRDPSREAPEAELFGRVREAAEVLRRDGDAARLGEALFEAKPDPDLALALAICWARAGEAGRATTYAVRAIELGFRDWERLAETRELAGLGGAIAEARRAAEGE